MTKSKLISFVFALIVLFSMKAWANGVPTSNQIISYSGNNLNCSETTKHVSTDENPNKQLQNNLNVSEEKSMEIIKCYLFVKKCSGQIVVYQMDMSTADGCFKLQLALSAMHNIFCD